MSRYEILNEIDPDWSERYQGDVDLAWNFYYQYAREEIERVKRENKE